MLVITRRQNEAVMLGDDLLVRVVEIDPKRVKLAVTRLNTLGVPAELWLAREEIAEVVGGITLEVVDIRDDKLRLGIDAPKNVSIHRKEVYDAIRRELGRRVMIGTKDRRFRDDVIQVR